MKLFLSLLTVLAIGIGGCIVARSLSSTPAPAVLEEAAVLEGVPTIQAATTVGTYAALPPIETQLRGTIDSATWLVGQELPATGIEPLQALVSDGLIAPAGHPLLTVLRLWPTIRWENVETIAIRKNEIELRTPLGDGVTFCRMPESEDMPETWWFGRAYTPGEEPSGVSQEMRDRLFAPVPAILQCATSDVQLPCTQRASFECVDCKRMVCGGCVRAEPPQCVDCIRKVR